MPEISRVETIEEEDGCVSSVEVHEVPAQEDKGKPCYNSELAADIPAEAADIPTNTTAHVHPPPASSAPHQPEATAAAPEAAAEVRVDSNKARANIRPALEDKGNQCSNSKLAADTPPEAADIPTNTTAHVHPPPASSAPLQPEATVATSEVRIDLNKARASIRPNDKFPDVLTCYTFDWNEPTSIHPQWHESTDELENIARALIEGLRFAHAHPVGEKAGYVRALVENFVLRFKAKLDAKGRPLQDFQFPWGTNWYQFSVTVPCMLAHYLLLGSVSLEKEAIALIDDLIATPRQSLGWKRDMPNSLYMAGPWLLAQHLSGNLDQALAHEDYAYALAQAKMEVRCGRRDVGVHRDRSFYCHDLGVFFAHLADLCSDLTRYYYALDAFIEETPATRWNAARKILFHPTIGFGNVGLVGRRRSLQCQTEPASEYGVMVMPFCRYMRYFTPERQFNVRAQVDHLAFYEADKSVDDMAQYWVQYRRAHGRNDHARVAFPDSGFICKAGQDTPTRVPSTTHTTQTFTPKHAKSMVMAYRKLGVLYQEYEIAEFGDYAVAELIVANEESATVTIKTRVRNREGEALAYYGAAREKMNVPANGAAVFKMLIRMDDGSTSVGHIREASFPTFPLKLSDTLTIHDLSDVKSYVLFEQGLPVLSAPYEWDEEPKRLAQIIHGRSYVFEFCPMANQYVHLENVKKNSSMSKSK